MRSTVLILVAAGIATAAGQFAYRWLSANWDSMAPPMPESAASNAPLRLEQVRFPDLSGKSQTFAAWSGKVIVVNFWATWCAPCKEEMPTFSRLQDEFGPRGVQFVGIAIDDLQEVKNYLAHTPVSYPVLMGEKNGVQWAVDLGDTVQVLPFTAILDRAGRIARVKAGPFSHDDLHDVLTHVLGQGIDAAGAT